jgi:hypothetical protein
VTAEIVWPQPERSLEEILGNPVGARHSVEALPSLLHEGERVLTGATAFLEGRSGLVVATTERLLFLHRDEPLIDWDYPSIGHFRALAGLVVADLQIERGDERVVIKQVHPRQRLSELADILGRSPAAPSP